VFWGAAVIAAVDFPRLPAKGLNSGLFFLAFPVVAYFLLHGGGLSGFAVSWTAGLFAGLDDSIGNAGRGAGVTPARPQR